MTDAITEAHAQGPHNSHADALLWASEYVSKGYAVLAYPLPRRAGKKGPNTHWDALTLRQQSDIFRWGPLLGQATATLAFNLAESHLIDIDLDCDEAAKLAPHFLPATGMISGHPSNEGSHWWYRQTQPVVEAQQFRDPTPTNDDVMLLEIRAGHQLTVVPPSPYAPQPKERYEWVTFGDPTNVSQEELVTACSLLAAASLLLRVWRPGARHELSLCLCGWLLQAGWPEDKLETLLQALCIASDDREGEDRIASLNTTQQQLSQGEPVRGWSGIIEMFGHPAATQLRKWLLPRSEASRHAVNDLGNAELTIKQHHNHIRYVTEWREWANYSSGVWARDEGAGVEAVKHSITRAADHWRAVDEKAHEWYSKSQSTARLLGAERLMRTDQRVAASLDVFDAKPLVLNLRGGELDLEQETPRPHQAEDYITRQAPVVYDPAAKCPNWLYLLEQWQPDPEVRFYLQQCIGYCLTGLQTERIFFVLYGAGRNGKSTFINTLATVLFGKGANGYAYQANTATFMVSNRVSEISSDLVRMRATRFVGVPEFPGRTLNIELVKGITGGDPWTGRDLYARISTYQPQCKLWFTTNARPLLPPDDPATWDRVRAIPFTQKFEPDAQNYIAPELIQKRISQEASGILNWALDGLRSWASDGLHTPKAVLEANEEYRRELDTVGTWLDEETAKAPVDERVDLQSVWECFWHWARGQGFDRQTTTPHSSRELASALRERGYTIPVKPGQRAHVYGLVLRMQD